MKGVGVMKIVVCQMMLISYETWPEAGRVLRACVSASAARAAADVRADPDLTSHLFLTLSTLTKKIPESLQWIEDLLSQLVELGQYLEESNLCICYVLYLFLFVIFAACRCVTVWEAQTARGACTWLIALAARRPAPLLPHAPALTAAAVCCIGKCSLKHHHCEKSTHNTGA